MSDRTYVRRGKRREEGGSEEGGERPDEWSHVFIISNREKDVPCLELVDEVDPEQVGRK